MKITHYSLTVIGIRKECTMIKRYMKEYGNDILKRKKELFCSKDQLTKMEARINKVINLYNRGYLTITEMMKALVDIDNDY